PCDEFLVVWLAPATVDEGGGSGVGQLRAPRRVRVIRNVLCSLWVEHCGTPEARDHLLSFLAALAAGWLGAAQRAGKRPRLPNPFDMMQPDFATPCGGCRSQPQALMSGDQLSCGGTQHAWP